MIASIKKRNNEIIKIKHLISSNFMLILSFLLQGENATVNPKTFENIKFNLRNRGEGKLI